MNFEGDNTKEQNRAEMLAQMEPDSYWTRIKNWFPGRKITTSLAGAVVLLTLQGCAAFTPEKIERMKHNAAGMLHNTNDNTRRNAGDGFIHEGRHTEDTLIVGNINRHPSISASRVESTSETIIRPKPSIDERLHGENK